MRTSGDAAPSRRPPDRAVPRHPGASPTANRATA
jgi:hypothetical protein